MLETYVISALIAVVVSAVAHFLSFWALAIRVRRLELSLSEWEERLVTEQKRRAGQASVAARGRLNPLDEALIKQHTGVEMTADDEPWWAAYTKKS